VGFVTNPLFLRRHSAVKFLKLFRLSTRSPAIGFHRLSQDTIFLSEKRKRAPRRRLCDNGVYQAQILKMNSLMQA
jgi:hypothetical protein